MEKLLVIGAGIGQVELVKLAKSSGIYVCVVSPSGYPAIKLADEHFDCDIYEYDKIMQFAAKNHFAAVTSDQNDLVMPTVAYVAQKLKLPGNTYEQVISYCNKNKFRSICKIANVPTPANIEVKDTMVPEFEASFPWIVKPADSQSSIGVRKISSMNEYETAAGYALQKSRTHSAIVEEFYEGTEIVAEGFVYDGKYYNLFLGDRRYFKGTLIPCQTLFPSLANPKVLSDIIHCEERITAAIKPRFGIVHSEYLVKDLVNYNGDMCIVESAIRGGGVYISSHLVPYATGININELLIKCALGEANSEYVGAKLRNRKNFASAYVCFTLPEGTVSGIKGLQELNTIDGVTMNFISDINIGTKTEPMIAKGMRKGPILIKADNRNTIEGIIDKIKETLKIQVISEKSLGGIVWD